MSRDYKLYIQDILNASDNIADYTRGLSFETFSGDKMRLNAVERNLEIIGEAVKGIPREIRDNYPDIDWRGYAGLRDILIHQYFRVNLNIIWDVVQNELPLLRQEMSNILAQES